MGRTWCVVIAAALFAIAVVLSVPFGVIALAAPSSVAPARDIWVGAAGAGAFRDAASALSVPLINPRTPAQAIAWATAAATGPAGWYRRCLAFTAQAYGWNHSGSPTAIDHWTTTPAGYRHTNDRSTPPGALLYWATGTAGHVALYLGRGLIASTDILRTGSVDIVPIQLIEQRWGAVYLGWTPPYYPHAS